MQLLKMLFWHEKYHAIVWFFFFKIILCYEPAYNTVRVNKVLIKSDI